MENLAGKYKLYVDDVIKSELGKAAIDIFHRDGKGEVKYSIAGRLGDWDFSRAWTYWVANSSEREFGLPLDVANKLHRKKYPLKEETAYSGSNPRTYGKFVRVEGHCGCPAPSFVKHWGWCDPQYVDLYHVDTQEGLNELARTIRKLPV